VNYLTGKAYEKKGSKAQAAAFFRQATSLKPEKALYHEALGDSYLQSENFTEAMREYEKAASLGKVAPMTLYRLGLWYFKKGESNKSLSYLERAVREKKGLINAHMALSSIYLENKKFAKCIEQCDTILRLQPANDTGYYNKACAYAMLGQKQEAISNLRKAIELLPSNKKLAGEKIFQVDKDTKEFREMIY